MLALAFTSSAVSRGFVLPSLYLGLLFELRASGHLGTK